MRTDNRDAGRVMRRVLVIASGPANGKSTVARKLASRLGHPYVDLDAIVWTPGWVARSAADVRRRVETIVESETWVIDGSHFQILGEMTLAKADTIVWIDLPLRVSWVRLVRRVLRRVRTGELYANGNRERIVGAFFWPRPIIARAIVLHCRRRRHWPAELSGYPVVRLRSQLDVDAFVTDRGSEPRMSGRRKTG